MKVPSFAIAILILISLMSLSFISRTVQAADPVVIRYQSKTAYFIDFNGCFDNPAAPNPIQVLQMPIAFTKPSGTNRFATVFVFAREKVSLGGCLAQTFPIVTSISDGGGNVYTRRLQFQINPAFGIPWFGEIWTGKLTAGMQTLTVQMDTAHLRVYGHATEWSGVNSFVTTPYWDGGPVVSGDASYTNVTWANTTGTFWGSAWSNQVTTGCGGKEPDCFYPATSASSGTGGYNENNLEMFCTLPMADSSACSSNLNANGKQGGGDNKTGLGGDGISVYQFRANATIAGQHTIYLHTAASAATQVGFVGLILYQLVSPVIPPCSAQASDPCNTVMNYGFVFGFFLLITLGLVFAWKFHEWREGD